MASVSIKQPCFSRVSSPEARGFFVFLTKTNREARVGFRFAARLHGKTSVDHCMLKLHNQVPWRKEPRR